MDGDLNTEYFCYSEIGEIVWMVCCAICGNGYQEGDEVCDDGNIMDGDGCLVTCVLEFCDGDINFDNGYCYKLLDDELGWDVVCSVC